MKCHLIYQMLFIAAIWTFGHGTAWADAPTSPPVDEQIDDIRRDIIETFREAGRSLDEVFNDNDKHIVISELGIDAVGARELMGARVRSRGGEAVAMVEDLVIDEDGDLRVIIVSQGGILGVGANSVPLKAGNVALFRTRERRVELFTELTETELAKAAGTVYVIRSETADRWVSDLLQASALLDAETVNVNGVKIATLHDIIFNRRRDITHAILSVGGFLDVGDKLVAAPLDSLDILKTREGLKLAVSVSKETLEGLPAFKYE